LKHGWNRGGRGFRGATGESWEPPENKEKIRNEEETKLGGGGNRNKYAHKKIKSTSIYWAVKKNRKLKQGPAGCGEKEAYYIEACTHLCLKGRGGIKLTCKHSKNRNVPKNGSVQASIHGCEG